MIWKRPHFRQAISSALAVPAFGAKPETSAASALALQVATAAAGSSAPDG